MAFDCKHVTLNITCINKLFNLKSFFINRMTVIVMVEKLRRLREIV